MSTTDADTQYTAASGPFYDPPTRKWDIWVTEILEGGTPGRTQKFFPTKEAAQGWIDEHVKPR